MRYYIIAGERSGDLHGGNLVKALQKYDPQARFRGFGGEYMQDAGAELLVHYNDLAMMGMVEWIKNLRKFKGYIKKCQDDIREFKPDVIILIDYGGFNLQIAKFARREGYRVFYYIPPKVWAWYQRRALQLKANVDKLFVILPFEKDFFQKFDTTADYVGNPILDAVRAHQPVPDFKTRYNLNGNKPLVALLPGSRKQELAKIVPVMAAVAKANPQWQFGVAAIDNMDKALYAPFDGLSNITFVHEATYDLLTHATAAIVTSGTATLETALFRVPQVVVYRTTPASYLIASLVVKVPFISLVNLIAGKEVVRELIQQNATPEKISDQLTKLITDDSSRNHVLQGYEEMITLLDTGASASDNTARLMYEYLTISNDQLTI